VPPKTGLYNVKMGPLRLFQRELADQLFWWLPLTILGLVLLWRTKRTEAVLWGGWALAYLGSFSFVRDVFHPYYLPPLAIAICALTGVGVAQVLQVITKASPILIAITALWQVWLLTPYPAWAYVLIPIALLSIIFAWRLPKVALVLLCIAPFAWCISAACTYCNAPLVYAGPARFTKEGPDPDLIATPQLWQGQLTDADRPKLLAYLKQERHGAKFLLAVQSTVPAAPVILRTGEAVMAMGGFTGGDPILTPETLAERVKHGEVRFFLLPPQDTVLGHNGPLMEWIRNHGLLVDPILWRDADSNMQLYDLGNLANLALVKQK
jgi:4-amino-4-deoxy-L-arabinose transferase-like glycosyltransferase